MNRYFDSRFPRREKTFRRNYAVDDDFYRALEEYAGYYDASVTELINACLEHLISTENVTLYKKENELLVTHTLLIHESNIRGLDQLNEKFGVSIYKLVNIAIRNVIEDI